MRPWHRVFTLAGNDDRRDVNITRDWERSDWSSLPLGIALLKLTRICGVPVQWNAQYEYNVADDPDRVETDIPNNRQGIIPHAITSCFAAVQGRGVTGPEALEQCSDP